MKNAPIDTYTVTSLNEELLKLLGIFLLKHQFNTLWKKTALITVYGSKNKKDHHISITEIHAAPLTPVLKKKKKRYSQNRIQRDKG